MSGGWQNQEREPNGQFGPSLEVAQAPQDQVPPGFGKHPINTKKNIRDLATVIETEARDTSPEAKTAVGAVVINRMRRNRTSDVQSVWDGFAHHIQPLRESYAIAETLLNHPENDPAHGATHFYTPDWMPKEGSHPAGRGRTLESVPGVVTKSGAPIRNYRPHYADVFPEQVIPGIPPKMFKFYRDPGHGPTR